MDPDTLTESAPDGFTVRPAGGDSLIIHHKRTGMRRMKRFIIFWFAIWTGVCLLLLRAYLTGAETPDGRTVPLWFALPFWVLEVVVACVLAYLLFCRKSFRLGAHDLTVATNILGLTRTEAMPKESIERLLQVRDGGEGEDSFPSWGLEVEGDRTITLLRRQPYEASHWLGKVLAEWADAEFIEASRE